MQENTVFSVLNALNCNEHVEKIFHSLQQKTKNQRLVQVSDFLLVRLSRFELLTSCLSKKNSRPIIFC